MGIGSALRSVLPRMQQWIGSPADTRWMDVPELILGAVLGVGIGAPLGAFVRPHVAWLEKRSRRTWNVDPLILHCERDPSIIWAGVPDWIGDSVYIDDPLRVKGPIPPDRDTWSTWIRSYNAFDAYRTTLKITLQARVEAAVVIENILVHVHRAVPVTRGAILRRGVGGASVEPRRFSIDLDWGSPPVITWRGRDGSPLKPHALKLAAGDVEVFHVWAEAKQPVWYEWAFELVMLVEGRRVRRLIKQDDGSWFITVGGEGLDMWMNYSGSGEWHRQPGVDEKARGGG